MRSGAGDKQPSGPPVSPATKKGLPPQLKALVNSKTTRTSVVKSQPNPEDIAQANAYIEQALLLLKFRNAWEEAVNTGDKQKALAFMSKSYKLIATSVKLMKQLRGKEKDELWAAIVCQSLLRARRERRKFKNHLHRYKVMTEMVQTERSYMRSLGIVESTYRAAAARHLSAVEVNVIFTNLAGLRSSNTPFWKAMESRLKEWNIESTVGDIYLSCLKDVLGEYISYVRGYDAALRQHEKCLGNSRYAKAMEECGQEEAVQGLTLGAFLILPIQRFPRYQLLITDMLKRTATDHPDHAKLKAALAEVVSHCSAINEATRNTEHFAVLQKIESLTGVRLTDKPNRMLKAEADIHENVGGKWQSQSVLIFDDQLLSVIKRTTKQVDVVWHVDGNNAHLVADPAASTFELIEYRNNRDMVRHVIRPVAGGPPLSAWSEALRQSQSSLSPKDWEAMRKLGSSNHHQRDARVVNAGHRMTGVYLLDEGKVAAAAPMGKHVRLQVSEYSKNTFFGFECMLRDLRFAYEATCTSASCLVSLVPFKDLSNVLAADPHFSRRFWHKCCVVLAEQFHLWSLPKSIEKHYLQVSGGADLNLRSTLAAVFQPGQGALARNPEEDAKVVALFGLPVGTTVVASFEDVQLGNKGRHTISAGSLYVFGGSVGFLSKLLVGRTYKELFLMSSIQKLQVDAVDSNKLEIVSLQGGKTESFYILNSKCFDAIKSAHTKWKRMSVSSATAATAMSEAEASNLPEKYKDPRLELSDAQWDLIFEKCGNVIRVRHGEAVLEEGQVVAKIFQVLRGRCRVEMEEEVIVDGVVSTTMQVVGRVAAGEMFGEKTFLFGGTATASVIGDSDNGGDTEVHALDKAQLERLFFAKPELAGGFYKTLAESIESRLSQRNTSVLLKYAALLGRKVQDGDIAGEQLFSVPGGAAAKNAALVRVTKPQRKDSLGMISASSVQAKVRPGATLNHSAPALSSAASSQQQQQPQQQPHPPPTLPQPPTLRK